jgi:hypothetical protein
MGACTDRRGRFCVGVAKEMRGLFTTCGIHDRRHGISKALIRSLERRQCGRITRRHCIQLDLCPLRLDFAFELRLIINPIGAR